jgi:hypothetical protein
VLVLQRCVLEHVFVQLPPQPSGPHALPVHCATQSHWPVLVLQRCVLEQVLGQLPPQPSGPHPLPVHCGTH